MTPQRFTGETIVITGASAGTGMAKPIDQMTSADWKSMMALHVDSSFHGAQAAQPHLEPSRGSMIFISSISGIGGDPRSTAYNTAKAAKINFTRSLAFLASDDARFITGHVLTVDGGVCAASGLPDFT